jgi:ribosomal protein L16 Arg81 hydroxylase
MEINKYLIECIEIFIKKCETFDELYKKVIKIIKNDINDNLDDLYDITNNYIEIRAAHGQIIKLYNKYKNSDLKTDEELYNLSTLSSILDNINNMIQNIDFQYKQFATFFPNLVNKNYLTVLLIVSKKETDEDTRLINMINEIRETKYENKYKIIKCGNKEGIELKVKRLNQKVKFTPKNTPALYLIDNNIISEIQTSNIKDKKMLEKIISK